MSHPDDAALRATWARIQPAHNALPFERAMAWPPLALVIRMAARGFRAGRQSVEHPVDRAQQHALRGRPPVPVKVVRKPAAPRLDHKMLAAGEREED